MPKNPSHKQILSEKQIKTLTMSLALLAVIGLIILAFLAWEDMRYPDDLAAIPLIEADKTPFKIKPNDPGGMQIEHIDRVIFDTLLESDTPQDTPEHTALRPDPETPIRREDIPPPSPPLPRSSPSASEPQTIDQAIEHIMQQPQTTSSVPGSQLETHTPTEPVRIQLASFRDKKQAQLAWKKMQTQHPALLGTLTATIEKADLGAKGIWYRLKAGPLPHKKAARKICSTLAGRKVACLIVD